MITEVVLRSAQASAICARLWPRSSAISLRVAAFCTFSGVTPSFVKKTLWPAARESAGMPWTYLFVSRPCASGQ